MSKVLTIFIHGKADFLLGMTIIIIMMMIIVLVKTRINISHYVSEYQANNWLHFSTHWADCGQKLIGTQLG